VLPLNLLFTPKRAGGRAAQLVPFGRLLHKMLAQILFLLIG